jgi:hypothetical protein
MFLKSVQGFSQNAGCSEGDSGEDSKSHGNMTRAAGQAQAERSGNDEAE